MPTERFDHVVIGAGSAGAVLAARLSERPEATVLLLEAGPDHRSDETPEGITSLNFFGALQDSDRIWPNVLASRSAGREASLYVRGRGVGGSSSINAMLAIRGIPDDYDRWAHELGCTGWSWNEMLPVFLAVEDDADYGGDGLHGLGGPIPLTRVARREASPLDVALRTAAAELGYPECDDYHAPGATGISRGAFTFRERRRVSTNDAYLEPARGRPNLDIRGRVLVDRVALEGRRAVGVVTSEGVEIEAGDVAVSAGAISSPAILLRSGIGPETGLPVGKNLMEHAATPGFELTLNERGRMRSTEAPVVSSVLRYSSGLGDAGPNDMQVIGFGAVGTTDAARSNGRMFAAVMRVYSRGEVRLRSGDPAEGPLVELNLLSDRRDLERLRDGVRRAIDILRHPAMCSITDGVLAGSEPLDALSDDRAIDAWLVASVNDYVHAAGTCRMGAVGDPAAVVDPACRVIGFEHLRVCDASVMPDLPRANTHLTTVAIAERVAALVRA